MRIEALTRYRDRNPDGYFQDLSPVERARAYQWLSHFCERWRGNLPRWRFAILVGQARRLARNPPSSAWGRSMLAKRGGKAAQRRYVLEDRLGSQHPSQRAAVVSKQARASRKKAQAEEARRKALGISPPSARDELVDLLLEQEWRLQGI